MKCIYPALLLVHWVRIRSSTKISNDTKKACFLILVATMQWHVLCYLYDLENLISKFDKALVLCLACLISLPWNNSDPMPFQLCIMDLGNGKDCVYACTCAQRLSTIHIFLTKGDQRPVTKLFKLVFWWRSRATDNESSCLLLDCSTLNTFESYQVPFNINQQPEKEALLLTTGHVGTLSCRSCLLKGSFSH